MLRPTAPVVRIGGDPVRVGTHAHLGRERAVRSLDWLHRLRQAQLRDAPPAAKNNGGEVLGELSGEWVHPLAGAIMTSGYGPRAAPAESSAKDRRNS